MTCTGPHVWQVEPLHSGHAVTRYSCTTCGCWGHRGWGGGRQVKPISAYAGPIMEPRPEWSKGSRPIVPVQGERQDGHFLTPQERDEQQQASAKRVEDTFYERSFRRRLRDL